MGLRDKVLDIIERGYQVELDFMQSLSEEERTACGIADKWCAKDIMAHNAFWKEHLANNIQAVARGEAPTPVDDYDQANLECFEENKDLPCDDVVAFSKRVHGLIAEAVRTMDENALQSEEAWPGGEGRPAWQSVVGTSYTHPITHLAQYHAEHGRGEKTTKLWKDAIELLGGLDEGTRWQGLMHYNQACMVSLAGMYGAAVEELRQALQLRPDLTEWSKQDPDLIPLRDRDDYRALYST